MPTAESSTNGQAPAPVEDLKVTPKRKPPVVLMGVLAIGLVIGGVYGGKWWTHRQAFVSTEDAQVAGNLITVSSRVPGRIGQLLVDEGQQVQAGQVVAVLDETDFKAQLAQAEAGLAVAKTGLKTSETGVSLQSAQTTSQIAQAEAGVRAARAALTSAEASAEKAHADLSRVERLFEAGGISKQAYEAAKTGATAADSALTAAKSQLSSAQEGLRLANAGTQAVSIKRGGVETVQAQIAQAEAAVNLAKLQLAHATITAPVSGVIARRMSNLGEQVAPGQGLYSLTETDKVWISSYIEETYIRRVHQGAPVDIRIDAYPGKTFHGKVQQVGSVTGGQFSLLPANNAAGNFTKVVQRIPVKIAVEDQGHELKPGMSAVIDIDARTL
ncbi:HlyD family secretion protein [bacterium]|nr:HlyD family secretion protein [bacterium]